MTTASHLSPLAWIALAFALVGFPILMGNVIGPLLHRRFGIFDPLHPPTRATMRRARHFFWLALIALEWTGAALVLAAAASDGTAGTDLGLNPAHIAVGLATAAPFAATFAIIGSYRNRSAGEWRGDDIAQPGETYLVPHDRFDDRVLFLAVAATAGICEELMFRALALIYLPAIVPTATAIAIATVSFVYFHGGRHQSLPWALIRGAFAIAMAVSVLRRDTLVVAIVIHFLVDAALIATPAHQTSRFVGLRTPRPEPQPVS